MKNRKIVHARQQVEIYKSHYRPSANPGRFLKSILGVLIFGSSSVAHSYVPMKKRALK
ncbi:MAG: hypothetical protein ICV66_03690 [Chitinophagaceae bacterium]|nr:hypothetical protein [Chitinophagaceae bacterium]